uniref:Uncharacterized protein n=1 Tax=Aegilops tauschii subsp. strangulata TaxID=200361 RepID=A0A453B2T2_AEGTS
MLPLCDQLFVLRIKWHSYCPLWKKKGLYNTHKCKRKTSCDASQPAQSNVKTIHAIYILSLSGRA